MARKKLRDIENPWLVKILAAIAYNGEVNISQLSEILHYPFSNIYKLVSRYTLSNWIIQKRDLTLNQVLLNINYSKITDEFLNFIAELNENMDIGEILRKKDLFVNNPLINVFWESLLRSIWVNEHFHSLQLIFKELILFRPQIDESIIVDELAKELKISKNKIENLRKILYESYEIYRGFTEFIEIINTIIPENMNYLNDSIKYFSENVSKHFDIEFIKEKLKINLQ